MSTEIVELPKRNGRTPLAKPAEQSEKKGGLTERQMDIAVEGSVQIVVGAMSIARDIVDIARIRSTAAADVARIEAQTRDVVEKMKVEVQKIVAQGEVTFNRGKAAAAVIEATMKFIPESDASARAKALDMLTTLIAAATAEGGSQEQE